MRASGNGNKAVCVQNLLAIVRGEVPYDRLRGLDPRIVDKPAADAVADAVQDAEWMLGVYEPRAKLDNVYATNDDDAADGVFRVTAEIS